MLALPLWYRAVAVVTAGVVEDALFLGDGFTRLALVTRSRRVSAVATGIVLALLHIPYWGLAYVLVCLAPWTVTIAFFVWRRDLAANIVAHLACDGMAFVVVPMFA